MEEKTISWLLKYINEAATKYKVFTSIVMPNMFEDGAAEKTTNNMARIVSDTYTGGWGHVSSWLRGQKLMVGQPSIISSMASFIGLR